MTADLDLMFKTLQEMCYKMGKDTGRSTEIEDYKIGVHPKTREIVLAALRKHGYYLTSRNTIRRHK